MSNGLDYHSEKAARLIARADAMAERDGTLGYDADKVKALAALAEAHLKFVAVQAYKKGQG